MYAVIKDGGKQYKVEPGRSLQIDLKENVKKEEAEEIKKKFEAAGAQVELK